MNRQTARQKTEARHRAVAAFTALGLSPEWQQHFSVAVVAKAYADRGFSPDEAAEWKAAIGNPDFPGGPYSPQDCAGWRDAGFSPVEAARQINKLYPRPMRTR